MQASNGIIQHSKFKILRPVSSVNNTPFMFLTLSFIPLKINIWCSAKKNDVLDENWQRSQLSKLNISWKLFLKWQPWFHSAVYSLLKKTPQSTFGESSTKPCGATFPHPTAGYYLKCSSLWKTRFSISTLVIGCQILFRLSKCLDLSVESC